MASMTDLVFLLLIFFMLTSTLVTSSALDVILPKSKAQSVNKASITVTIDSVLKVSVNDAIVPMDQLELQLLSLASQDPERLVILRADESVPTGETVRIMDIAYRNRLKLVLATDPR